MLEIVHLGTESSSWRASPTLSEQHSRAPDCIPMGWLVVAALYRECGNNCSQLKGPGPPGRSDSQPGLFGPGAALVRAHGIQGANRSVNEWRTSATLLREHQVGNPDLGHPMTLGADRETD